MGDQHGFSPVLTGSASLGVGAAVLPDLNQPQYTAYGNLPISRKINERLPLGTQANRSFGTYSSITSAALITDSGTVSAETGPVWAQYQDDHMTAVGRFIRKSRLDELPQLINVLKGDMSFVGPRPERPFFVEQLHKEIPYYSLRHEVKPGITGWAQIQYSYGASKEDALEKLQYDLFYIKHLSVWLDMMIILETIKVVLLGRGSR